jgi:hypothetical protein
LKKEKMGKCSSVCVRATLSYCDVCLLFITIIISVVVVVVTVHIGGCCCCSARNRQIETGFFFPLYSALSGRVLLLFLVLSGTCPVALFLLPVVVVICSLSVGVRRHWALYTYYVQFISRASLTPMLATSEYHHATLNERFFRIRFSPPFPLSDSYNC